MTLNSTVVTFSAADATFAVPVSKVKEILDLREISRMPHAPHYFLGMIDIRGDNVPVVDLRRILGAADTEDTPATRILVLEFDNEVTTSETIGIRCDRVIEVTSLDEGSVRPVTSADTIRWNGEVIAGIGRKDGELVTQIDIDRLFDTLDIPQSAA